MRHKGLFLAVYLFITAGSLFSGDSKMLTPHFASWLKQGQRRFGKGCSSGVVGFARLKKKNRKAIPGHSEVDYIARGRKALIKTINKLGSEATAEERAAAFKKLLSAGKVEGGIIYLIGAYRKAAYGPALITSGPGRGVSVSAYKADLNARATSPLMMKLRSEAASRARVLSQGENLVPIGKKAENIM